MRSPLTAFADELSLRQTLGDAATMCALGGGLIVGSLSYNPEIWWNDYPTEVKKALGPMSARARREAKLLAILFAAVLLGLPLYSSWRQRQRRGDRLSFRAAFANAFLVASAFNLFDLLAIDLPLVKRQPKRWLIPGAAELMREHRDFRPHVKGALKGIGFSLALATLAGLLTGTDWRRHLVRRRRPPVFERRPLG